jgi:hypothetical protein
MVVTAAVEGFENRLLTLLMRGLVLHRPVKTTDGYQLHGSRYVRLDEPEAASVVVFAGSRREDMEDREAARRLGRAAQTGLPILGLAEQANNLPPLLQDAALPVIRCGPLTPAIVRRVIETVLGEACPATELDCDCTRLGLADLALAVRPGVSAERAFVLLQKLAAAKQENDGHEEDDNRKHKKAGRDAKGGGREVSTGSVIIQPETAEDAAAGPTGAKDADKTSSVPLRVETLSGYGLARDWALALKDDLALWREGALAWEEMSTRLILSGPPGTGKTTFARALCNTLQVPLIATSVATWLEPGYLGDVVKRMKHSFVEAAAHAPSILFIDEIDGIGRRGGGSRKHEDYWTSVVNRLLELLDGAARTSGVVVVGATNNPAVIDPAILRSGRLETHIEVPLPDTADLVGIFRHHLKGDLAAVVDSAPEPQLPRSAQEGAELDVPSDAKTSTGEVANAAEPCR